MLAEWLVPLENASRATRFHRVFTVPSSIRFLHWTGVSCRRTHRPSMWHTGVRFSGSILVGAGFWSTLFWIDSSNLIVYALTA